MHCQTHDLKYTAGGSLPVFGADFGPFGVLICADRRWPETVRTLALKGARVIFNPTYGMHDERNLHMMQTRSYESELFIAFTHPQQALLTAPTGQVICNETRDDVSFVVNTDRSRRGGPGQGRGIGASQRQTAGHLHAMRRVHEVWISLS